MAVSVAAANPDQATQIADRATHAAHRIARQWQKAEALRDIAAAVAAANPDQATQIADRATMAADLIADAQRRAKALRDIAVSVAAANPDQATQIAERIAYAQQQEEALRHIAETVAYTNPENATRIVQKAWIVGSWFLPPTWAFQEQSQTYLVELAGRLTRQDGADQGPGNEPEVRDRQHDESVEPSWRG